MAEPLKLPKCVKSYGGWPLDDPRIPDPVLRIIYYRTMARLDKGYPFTAKRYEARDRAMCDAIHARLHPTPIKEQCYVTKTV